MIETHAYFSVRGGKFHKPAEPFERSRAWRPTLTLCGITVTPLNYFESADDANRHTGGRLAKWECARCRAKGGSA